MEIDAYYRKQSTYLCRLAVPGLGVLFPRWFRLRHLAHFCVIYITPLCDMP